MHFVHAALVYVFHVRLFQQTVLINQDSNNRLHLSERGIRTGRSGVRISLGAIDFSLARNVQTHSGDHPASCSVSIDFIYWGKSD